MLIGITIDRFKDFTPSTLLSISRKIGLNFVELTKSVFDDLPGVLKEIGSMRTGFHLPNEGDSGYDLSCADRQDEIDQLIHHINEHRHGLKIQYCLTHPPECQSLEDDRQTVNTILFENLKKLKPPVIIENIESMSQTEFSEFYLTAKKELGDQLVGQCYDVPHSFLRGENPLSILNHHNGLIKTVHLSDCRPDRDSHLPFGMGGVLPIDEVLAVLKRTGYDGIINLELLPRSNSDFKAVITSYLSVLKTFKKGTYFLTKLRLLYYMSRLKSMFANN